MDRIKCTACKRQKFVSDFLKNGKTLKTCITCRAPKRSVTVDSVVKTSVEQKEPVVIPVVHPVEIPQGIPVVIKESVPKNRWIHLSGKWIQIGKERELHEECMKKMNREFLKRSSFAVHKYLTRWVMIDIRDL